MDDMDKTFGSYLRRMRGENKISLRNLSNIVGLSHVYIAEVERGVAKPLQEEHWGKFVMAIPGLKLEKLRELAMGVGNYKLNFSQQPKLYSEVGLVLARRMEDHRLEDEELKQILEILQGPDDE